EEEYLKEFMEVNGYNIVLGQLPGEDGTIDRLSKEICALICPKLQSEIEYCKKIIGDTENGVYMKRGSKLPAEHKESYHPIIFGENSYFDLKSKRRMKMPEPLNAEQAKRLWEKSSKTILLDYDGTLTPIVEDPDKAVLSARAKEILMNLSKAGRVVICSGRSKAKLDEWIPKEIEVYAEHGAFQRVSGEWSTI
ncbi:trehalose-phosphatase, partial [Vittaforma corneae ATCC 50505]